MINKRNILTLSLMALLAAFLLPGAASAQWGRGNNRDDDYRNDRNSRNNRRNNDDYYGNNGRYNNSSQLYDAVRRVEQMSDRFKDNLDSDLDNSRINGTRQEDELNRLADNFQDAADRLRSSVGNNRNNNNIYRGQNDAQRLVQIASQIDSYIGRGRGRRMGTRSQSDWSQIRQDVRVIADAYNISYNNRGSYNNGGYNNDDYRNNRNNRNNGNNGSWRNRLPQILGYPN